ncbi:hypothetical protein HYW94_03275 [Candidatus Uhrbacteria bacterium]|nr:hypothetical protein [Candidatus Uhrbacteria bacterium]
MHMEQSESPARAFVERKKFFPVPKILWYILLAVVVLGIGYYGWRSYERSKLYSIVYLQTGEIYVGKLSFFPKVTLADPYILRVTKDEKDPKKNNFQLSPLKETVWNTKSLTLNKPHIVFYGLLDKDSQAGRALSNRSNKQADKQAEPATLPEVPARAPAQVPIQAPIQTPTQAPAVE